VIKIRLPYINSYVDRLGKVRHYLRKPGIKPVALPGLPGSDEFMGAYTAALAGIPGTDTRIQIGSSRTRAGSISAMIAGYLASAKFANLAPTSKAQYQRFLEDLRTDYGDMSMKALQRKHVAQMIDDRKDRPTNARDFLRCLRIVIAHAIRVGARDDDPTIKMTVDVPNTGGHHSWSETEIAAFRAHYQIGTKERLALEILLGTALRCADAIRLGPQHVHNGALVMPRTQKTKADVTIPISAELATAITAAPTGNLVYLLNEHGRPFPAAGFSRWFGGRAKLARLTRCSAHGLRKAAARRLAEAGCSAPEIASITGHRSLKEVQRYIDAADRVRLAANAAAKLRAVK
jgi:integrase